MSTLAVIGLFEALRNKWIILLYLLIASLPGLAFTLGYNWSQRYYSILRNFPDTLTPAPPDIRLLETYYFFKNNSDLVKNAIIVADRDFAKYVHMAIRNPDPLRLIWGETITGDQICRLMNITGVEKTILVAVYYVSGMRCSLEVKPVSDELNWIKIVQMKK
jgi:hypothetical protein